MGFAKRHIEQNLVPDYPQAVSGKFNIGLLHTSLAGSDQHDTYAPCTLAELTDFGYDYWALGHIHKREILSSNPHVVFSGNIQGRHIRETGPRGCYLVRVDAEFNCSTQFHPLDVLHWFHIEVDVGGLSDESEVFRRVREDIENTVSESGNRLLALRVTLQGQTSLSTDFYLHRDRWFNEVLSIAQQLASAGVWLESLKVKTIEPRGSDSTAELSDLGSMVMQNLRTEQLQDFLRESAWPVEITQMLNKLSSKQKSEVEATLLADVSSFEAGKDEAGNVAVQMGRSANEHLLGEVSNLVNAAVRGKMTITDIDQTGSNAEGKQPTPLKGKSRRVTGEHDGGNL